jgi:DNA-binding transcriptional ArsR family regulator
MFISALVASVNYSPAHERRVSPGSSRFQRAARGVVEKYGEKTLREMTVGIYITITLCNQTVMHASERLDLTFAALADPTRRAILARLATGEATVTELAQPFKMSQPAISKHLKVLERAGLISMDVDAQRRPRRMEPKRLEQAVDWIERYREIFEQNYQRLDALLEELQAKPSTRKRTKK